MGTSYAAILRMSIPKIAFLRTPPPTKVPVVFSRMFAVLCRHGGVDDVAFSGERMRSARVNRGMSQEDVAVAIGMSVDSVGRYEAGKAPRGEKRRPRSSLLRHPQRRGGEVGILVYWGKDCSVEIRSASLRYPPRTFDREEIDRGEFRIIGRVVHILLAPKRGA